MSDTQGIPPPPPAPPSLPAPERTPPPWEHEGPVVQRFVDTAKEVLLQPGPFFKSIRREGGLGPPLVYAVIGTVVGTLGSLVTRMMMPMDGSASSLVLGLVVAPILSVVGLFVGGGLLHVLLILVAGAKEPFETTFRLVAYTSGSTSPLGLIPFIGGVIGLLWGLVVLVLGAAEIHEVPQGKAAIAVVLPAVLCCGLAFLFASAILVMIFGAAAAGMRG